MSTLRSPLGKAKGIGSAKDGTHHWLQQRLTAVALIPLFLWFMISIVSITGAENVDVAAWLANPIQAILCILFIIMMFWHGSLGVQVVIEDYVSNEFKKIFAIFSVKILCIAGALTGVLSVLSIYFKG